MINQRKETEFKNLEGIVTKRKFGQGGIKYFISQIFQATMAVIRGLILPNILGPFHYGIVSTLNLMEKYSKFTNFGIHKNILYKAPYYKTKGNSEEIEKIKNNCFYFTLITGVVVVVAIFSIAIFNFHKLNTHLFWGLLIMSFYPLLLSIRSVYMISLRIDKNFNLIAKIVGITTLLVFGLAIVLGLLFKSIGVLFGQVIAIFVCILILIKISGYRFKFKINTAKIIEFLKFSIPIIFVIEVLLAFLTTIDRIMILRHLGVIFVGFYTIGLSICGLIMILPLSIATVVSPTLIEEYGKPDGKSADLFLTTTYFTAIFVAFFLAVVSISAPAIIYIIFPKYELGIQSAQIIPFAFYFEGITKLGGYALITLNKTKSYISSLILSSLIALLIFERFLPGRSLFIAAILTVVVYGIKSLTIMTLASLSTFKNSKTAIRFLGTLMALIVFTTMICWLLNNLFPSYDTLNTADLIKFSFFKISIFSLIYIPIFIYFIIHTENIKSYCVDLIKTIKQKFITM